MQETISTSDTTRRLSRSVSPEIGEPGLGDLVVQLLIGRKERFGHHVSAFALPQLRTDEAPLEGYQACTIGHHGTLKRQSPPSVHSAEARFQVSGKAPARRQPPSNLACVASRQWSQQPHSRWNWRQKGVVCSNGFGNLNLAGLLAPCPSQFQKRSPGFLAVRVRVRGRDQPQALPSQQILVSEVDE